MRRVLMALLAATVAAATVALFAGTGVAHADPSKLPGLVCDQNPSGAHNPLCPNGPPGPPDKICDGPAGAHNPHCPNGNPGPPPGVCDGPAGAHNPHCQPPPPPPPPPEDVCETGGLLTPETIADHLVDAGIPLHEPEADGPISSALVGSQLEATPLAPVVNEAACAVNLLTL